MCISKNKNDYRFASQCLVLHISEPSPMNAVTQCMQHNAQYVQMHARMGHLNRFVLTDCTLGPLGPFYLPEVDMQPSSLFTPRHFTGNHEHGCGSHLSHLDENVAAYCVLFYSKPSAAACRLCRCSCTKHPDGHSAQRPSCLRRHPQLRQLAVLSWWQVARKRDSLHSP